MTRRAIDPRHYGVDMDAAEFMDLMVDEFNSTFFGSQSFDELLWRPREALRLCDDVRQRRHFFDVPDEVILRSIMIRRKNP
jgi:hypothetical protein